MAPAATTPAKGSKEPKEKKALKPAPKPAGADIRSFFGKPAQVRDALVLRAGLLTRQRAGFKSEERGFEPGKCHRHRCVAAPARLCVNRPADDEDDVKPSKPKSAMSARDSIVVDSVTMRRTKLTLPLPTPPATHPKKDTPAKRKKLMLSDDDDESPPKKKAAVIASSDEDEKPVKKPALKKSKKDYDEDFEMDDDEPKKPATKPRTSMSKKRVVEDEDDDDDNVKPKKPAAKPRASTSKKRVVDDDEDDEDEDVKPKKKAAPRKSDSAADAQKPKNKYASRWRRARTHRAAAGRPSKPHAPQDRPRRAPSPSRTARPTASRA